MLPWYFLVYERGPLERAAHVAPTVNWEVGMSERFSSGHKNTTYFRRLTHACCACVIVAVISADSLSTLSDSTGSTNGRGLRNVCLVSL